MLFFLFNPIHICSWLIEPELIRMPEKHGILRAMIQSVFSLK